MICSFVSPLPPPPKCRQSKIEISPQHSSHTGAFVWVTIPSKCGTSSSAPPSDLHQPAVSPLWIFKVQAWFFLVPELRCFSWAFGFVPLDFKWKWKFISKVPAIFFQHSNKPTWNCGYVKSSFGHKCLFYQLPRLISWLKSFACLQSSKLCIVL